MKYDNLEPVSRRLLVNPSTYPARDPICDVKWVMLRTGRPLFRKEMSRTWALRSIGDPPSGVGTFCSPDHPTNVMVLLQGVG